VDPVLVGHLLRDGDDLLDELLGEVFVLPEPLLLHVAEDMLLDDPEGLDVVRVLRVLLLHRLDVGEEFDELRDLESASADEGDPAEGVDLL